MIAPQLRTYRFATAEHWRRCLLHRLDTSTGALTQTARLGTRAIQLMNGSHASAVAARPGALLWRVHAAGTSGMSAGVRWLDDNDAVAGPIEIDPSLAHSTRWIIDRDSLWAFDRKMPRVHRYNRETIERDLTIDLANVTLGGHAGASVAEVLDITSDGRRGLWVLVHSQRDRTWLVHLDCDGCTRQQFETPCAAEPVRQVASAEGGATLVLLTADGMRLWFVRAADGAMLYWRSVTDLANCRTGERLASDTRNRIALGVRQRGQWALLLLNAAGDVLEGPLTKLFDKPKSRQQHETAVDSAAPALDAGQWRVDLAVSRDKVWIARRDGLWFVDSTVKCEPGESQSVLLTPALLSPHVDTSKGWLRAEVLMNLPRGAVCTAEYASTNDERIATRLAGIAESSSMSARSKQDSIWAELEPGRRAPFSVTGTVDSGTAVAIPLFESEDRWLWLRLTIVTPPDAAATSISALRVLYPNLSLVDQLPAVFRGPDGDVGQTLRRLVGALEATTHGIDEKIRSIAASLNPDTAPNEWLNYVARWLALPWDDALPETAKRCVLRSAALLLAWRGTRRGLNALVRCLVGDEARITLTDLTVDHAALRLGGERCVGGSLPAILAGVSPQTATLGGKAVLGRACIGNASARCDPLASIDPTVQIRVATARAQSSEMKVVIKDLIAQYLPVGVKLALTWQVRADLAGPVGEGTGDALMVLDAEGSGALGTDSVIGRTVLTGRRTAMIDEAGLDLGFHL